MKFCVDCIHHELVTVESEAGVPPPWHYCNRPTNEIDLVTGEKMTTPKIEARIERLSSFGGKCGPDGKYWEKRA